MDINLDLEKMEIDDNYLNESNNIANNIRWCKYVADKLIEKIEFIHMDYENSDKQSINNFNSINRYSTFPFEENKKRKINNQDYDGDIEDNDSKKIKIFL
jgi:primosomal protein N''